MCEILGLYFLARGSLKGLCFIKKMGLYFYLFGVPYTVATVVSGLHMVGCLRPDIRFAENLVMALTETEFQAALWMLD